MPPKPSFTFRDKAQSSIFGLVRREITSQNIGSKQMALHDIGYAIYGHECVSPLARAIGVNTRTAQRWKSGETPVPKAVLENPALAYAAKTASADLQDRRGAIRKFLSRH